MSIDIKFFVPGIPAPGGSKRVFGIKKAGLYTGRFVVTDDAGQRNKDWRATVAQSGQQEMAHQGVPPMTGPLRAVFHFVMPRPKYHFNAKGKLKLSAPVLHIVKPDTTKLVRSTEDALKGICLQDDAQICEQIATKCYGERAGCSISISEAVAAPRYPQPSPPG